MSRQLAAVLIGFIILFTACEPKEDKALIAFDVYCEMVANEAKPLALHYPMTGEEIDVLWDNMLNVAADYDLSLYREDAFPVSLLFPASATNGKTVVLIYKGDRLTQYNQWKEDVTNADANDAEAQYALARRFGRLLGYTPQGINELLSKNTSFRSLASFEVTQQMTHLYYSNLDEAITFYDEILGLKQTDAAVFQISSDAFIHLHASDSTHPDGQPKSTAIALLTDQLPEWYAYVNEKKVPVKYTYKPKEGGPHDGFVAIDPGGYLLEFEEFKQHPENELFMAVLENAPRVSTSTGLDFFGSITWTYHKDMLKMQNFYNEVLGYTMVADQGWTKIYQTSPTGFIGLVDERRGMEDYADSKAVELEWKVSKSGVDAYAKENWQSMNYMGEQFKDPEQYIYHIRE